MDEQETNQAWMTILHKTVCLTTRQMTDAPSLLKIQTGVIHMQFAFNFDKGGGLSLCWSHIPGN